MIDHWIVDALKHRFEGAYTSTEEGQSGKSEAKECVENSNSSRSSNQIMFVRFLIPKWKKLFREMSSGNFVSVCSWQELSMFNGSFHFPFCSCYGHQFGRMCQKQEQTLCTRRALVLWKQCFQCTSHCRPLSPTERWSLYFTTLTVPLF